MTLILLEGSIQNIVDKGKMSLKGIISSPTPKGGHRSLCKTVPEHPSVDATSVTTVNIHKREHEVEVAIMIQLEDGSVSLKEMKVSLKMEGVSLIFQRWKLPWGSLVDKNEVLQLELSGIGESLCNLGASMVATTSSSPSNLLNET